MMGSKFVVEQALNHNRDALYADPRYNRLFPRHRRNGQPPSPPPSSLGSLSSRTLMTHSSSPAHSFASWGGIDANHLEQPANPQPFPNHPHQPPINVLHPHVHENVPAPALSGMISDRDTTPMQSVNERKFFLALLFTFLSSMGYHPLVLS